MGRYSSVQAYADNNANMRSIPYDQAVGSAEAKAGPVTAEKVNNPYGSTAGAGSGDFHVYRHARAREAERWKQMNQEEREKELEDEYQKKLEANRMEEEQRTAQRRKKRQRHKEAKLKKKNLALSGIILKEQQDIALPVGAQDDAFAYIPMAEPRILETDGEEETLPGKRPMEVVKKVPHDDYHTSPESMSKKLKTDDTSLNLPKS